MDVVHKDNENVSVNMLLTWKRENYSFHFPPFIENAFVWVEEINIYCNTLSRSSDFIIDNLMKKLHVLFVLSIGDEDFNTLLLLLL